MLLRDGHGGIGALAVDHDDFIHQAMHGLQAVVQVVRFVARDDDGRESGVSVGHVADEFSVVCFASHRLDARSAPALVRRDPTTCRCR